jgi:hypothetical protein
VGSPMEIESAAGSPTGQSLNQSPSDAPIVGSPVEIESVTDLVLGLAGISITPSNPVPLDAPIVGSPVAQEEESDAGAVEPPAQRRRITDEFQIMVAGLGHQCIILWVTPATEVLELKCRIVDKMGWWLTNPASLIVELEGHALVNDRTIGSHGVVSQSTLRMRSRGPGGAVHSQEDEEEDAEEDEEGPPEDRKLRKWE